MPSASLTYEDATVTVRASAFGGAMKIDIACRSFKREGMTPEEFMALVYPAIDVAAGPAPNSQPTKG